MPTYEYRCKACGHELEIVQAFTDDALTRCETCGADQLRKVFGSVGISFKGSGFYKNDSRGKTSTTPAPSTAGADSGSSNGSSDSSSTPAPAPAAKPAASTPSTAPV